MRAQMFKIAGVKNEKEFYKLFPDEASFMKKHGKAFKKAQAGMKIPKASGGFNFGSFMGGMGGQNDGSSSASGGQGVGTGINQIFQGIQTHKANKKAAKHINQMRQISNLNVRAMASGMDQEADREYFRSEDMIMQPDQFNSQFGAGTNAIGQDGAYIKIPKAQWGAAYNNMGTYAAEQNAVAQQQTVGKQTNTVDPIADEWEPDPRRGDEQNPKGTRHPGGQPQKPKDTKPKSSSLNPLGQAVETAFVAAAEGVNKGRGKQLQSKLQGLAEEGNAQIKNAGAYASANERRLAKQKASGKAAKKGMYKPMLGLAAGALQGIQWDDDGNIVSGGQQIGEGSGQVVGSVMSMVGGGGGGQDGARIPIAQGGMMSGGGGGGTGAITAMGGMIGRGFDRVVPAMQRDTAAIERNMMKMQGLAMAGNMQARHFGSMQDGGELPTYMEGGNVKPLWGGDVEASSHNPYGGTSYDISGNMHNGSNTPGRSGVGLKINGKAIEAEGGEVISNLQDGGQSDNTVIFGNLTPQKGLIDDADGKKKAKNIAKEINKKEMKANKGLSKNQDKLDGLEVITSFDKLKMNGIQAMGKGHSMRLKKASEDKQKLADWQNFTNEFAEQNGIVANDLARGKIKIDTGKFTPSNVAQDGTTLPKPASGKFIVAQDGTPPSTAAEAEEQGWELVSTDEKTGKTKWRKIALKGEPGGTIVIQESKKGKTTTTPGKSKKGNRTYAEAYEIAKKKWPEEYGDLTLEEYTDIAKKDKRRGKSDPVTTTTPDTPEITEEITSTEDVYDEIEFEGDKKKGTFNPNAIPGLANYLLPFFRPTDQDNFDYGQTLGEQYSMATNKVRPVLNQNYRPQLDVPMDISLQEHRNDVVSAANANRRLAQYNPGIAASIGAGEYDALTKINADEFRQNQGERVRVYDKNRATLNDAQLKNIALNDRQYVRQEQAHENTRAERLAALSSITDKQAKHKLENKTLGIYENMYNYRFGNNNVASNYNGFAQWNLNGRPGVQGGSINDQIVRSQEQVDYLKAQKNAQRKAAGGASGYVAQDGMRLKKLPIAKATKRY